jgi:hypothetical protein
MTPAGTRESSPSECDPDARTDTESRRSVLRVVAFRTALAAGVLFALMQFVPYGWWHENPPVVADAPWPDEASEQIARESCYSCHSNQTEWPIYSYVAPMSWLVRNDVERGRAEMNFSEWDPGDADDAIEMIVEGRMPPDRYVLIHRDARLGGTESATLIAALETMSDRDHDRGDSRDSDDDGGSEGRD